MEHQVVRRVTLLVSRNGSLLLVPEDAADGASLSGLGALLVATFAGGLVLNALLLVALASLARSRARAALALLVAANALDCLVNVPAAAIVVSSWASMVERAPHAAKTLCKLSAASGQLTSILQTFAVLVMVLDRCLAVAAPHGSSSSTFSLTPGELGVGKRPAGRCVSTATWALFWAAGPVAVALVSPIATSANVRVFPTRYACGLVRLGGELPWLGVLVLVLGYLAPWTALAVGVSLAARRAALQRWRRRQLELAALQQGRTNAGLAAHAGHAGLAFSLVDTPLGHLSLDEYRTLTLGTALFGMYVAMLVPGILSTQVLQVMTATPRAAHAPDYLWPVNTGTYETVLVWLRMQFAIVSPGVIVILSREVRRRVVEMVQSLYHALCCCRRANNAVGQALGQAQQQHLHLPQRRYAGKNRWARLRSRSQHRPGSAPSEETRVSAGTAVLFATSQGLHLRTLDPRWADEDADDVSSWVPGSAAPWAEASDSQPRYVFQFCDLAIIEEPAKTDGVLSNTASTALAFLDAPHPRRKVIAGSVHGLDESEPSLTREELQASLAKPRSLLASSYRKNVRFASVVSEIPVGIPVGTGTALTSVAEVDSEMSGLWSDPTTSSSTNSTSTSTSAASAASATLSPVRFARPRTRSLELALVSGELPVLPALSALPALNNNTFVVKTPSSSDNPNRTTSKV